MQKENMSDAELAEQLSAGIDEINFGRIPDSEAGENAGLLRLAMQIKEAAHDPEIPPIPGNIIGEISAVIGKKARQRKLQKVISVAAVAIIGIVFGSYYTNYDRSPEVAYNNPPPVMESGGAGIGSEGVNSILTAPKPDPVVPAAPPVLASTGQEDHVDEIPKPGPVVASRQVEGKTDSVKPAADLNLAAKTTASKTTIVVDDRQQFEPVKGRAAVVLAGVTPDRVTVDPATGTVRSVYNMGKKNEFIVTQADQPASPSKPTVMAKALLPQENGGGDKITLTMHGKEVTVEGKMSKTELQKIAESLKSDEEPE